MSREPPLTRRSFIIADPVVTTSQTAALARMQYANAGGSTKQPGKTSTPKMQQDFSRDGVRVTAAL